MGKQTREGIVLPKATLVIYAWIKLKPQFFNLCFSSLYYAIQIQVDPIFI